MFERFLYLGAEFEKLLEKIAKAEDRKKHTVTLLDVSQAIQKAMIQHRTYTNYLFELSNKDGEVHRHAKPQGFTRDTQPKKEEKPWASKGLAQNANDAKKGQKGLFSIL